MMPYKISAKVKLYRWMIPILLIGGLSSCGSSDSNSNSPAPAPGYTNYNTVGAGTASSPYQLFTAAQVEDLALNSTASNSYFQNVCFVVMNNIDFGQQALQIGTFNGCLNGQNYAFENISINSSDDAVGVFINLNSQASVTNLSFVNLSISATGSTEVGVIAFNWSTLSEISVLSGSINGSGSSVGGIVGKNYGTIEKSWVNGLSISGTNEVGGLVGENDGVIENCYVGAATVVNATGNAVGGLVGENQNSISISYALGSVTGQSVAIGGLVGENVNDLSQNITNCFAGASVTGPGSSNIDYVIGEEEGGSTAEGATYVSGIACNPSGSCASTVYSSNPSTFYYSSSNLTDFSTTIWTFNGTTFPTLQ